MPVPAVRAAFVPTAAEVRGKKGAIVFGAALGTFSPAKQGPAGTDAPKHEIGEQGQRAHEINYDPDLERDAPKRRAQSEGVRGQEENWEIAQPVKRHRSSLAEHESFPQLP